MEIGLSLSLTSNKGVGGPAWLASFMAGQSDGFWYSFTPGGPMFRETVGPTPAATANDVIGLALSQRLWAGQTLAQVVASQTPTLQDDFSSYADTAAMVAAGWDKRAATSGTVTLSSGAFQFTSAAVGLSSGAGKLVSGFTVGRCYQLTGRIRMVSGGGNVSLGLRNSDGGGGSSLVIAAPSVAGASFQQVTAYWVATQTTAYTALVPSVAGATAELDDIRISEVSRYPATQSTGSFKPTVQSGGAKGDATDDRHGTGFASSSGDAFNVYPAAIIPASLAATQAFAGAMDGSSNGDYLAVTTGGALRAKVGATTLDSTGIDLRGGTHDLAYWTDGATLYLYADGAIVASGPWTGSRPTTAWNLFALNNNGTASNFTGATMKAALRGAQALTVSLANQICRAA